MSFKDLGLSDKTIQAIEDLGYKKPTTVQKDVIPSILDGKDVFTIAPSACGKTCSYIFPLIDIISKKDGQNILIISAGTQESVNISDKFSIFNKYHESSETSTETEDESSEANVIIASPDLLLENISEGVVDVSNTNILVVDDINLIKKKHQLKKLNEILDLLPADKQNIIFTNRRSKETQDTLSKILKAPAEIKVDKDKESEATELKQSEPQQPQKPTSKKQKKDLYAIKQDKKAIELSKRFKIFGKKTPGFLLEDCKLAAENE